MAKEVVCPYCGYDLNTMPKGTSLKCPRCGGLIRIQGGSLYKNEELPPEVSCCFVGLFANIAREHEPGFEENFRIFLEEFLRSQNLTKKQYEYLVNMYNKECRKGILFRHENNKSYLVRLKNVIDETCSAMPMSEQELYEDSVLKMIINFIRSGGEISKEGQEIIDLYKSLFGINEKRYEALYKSITDNEKAKKEKVEKATKKKTVNEIFDDAKNEINNKLSQKSFVDDFINGFKRPFIIKDSSNSLSNIISILSKEDIFANELITIISNHMGQNKLTTGIVHIFDFLLYLLLYLFYL